MSTSQSNHKADPELTLRGISTGYGGIPVLLGTSVEIAKGESIAIIGPSGGGKSTLLRCINLIQPLTSGELYFRGDKVASPGRRFVNEDKFRETVGLVHQEWNLWPNKDVTENLIEAPCHLLGMKKREACDSAKMWLDRLELSQLAERYPHQLSGGQKQRVALGRSLMMNPSVLMLDEITSALDVETTAKMLRMFESLRDGRRTFIFVTHHLHFAEHATDRVAVLMDGHVEEVGPSSQVINSPSGERTQAFLATVRAVH